MPGARPGNRLSFTLLALWAFLPLVADVTSRAQVEALVAEAARVFGGVDILVNSGSSPGGSATAIGPVETVVVEDLIRDFDVKYVGALR